MPNSNTRLITNEGSSTTIAAEQSSFWCKKPKLPPINVWWQRFTAGIDGIGMPITAAWAFARGFREPRLMYAGSAASVFFGGGSLALQMRGYGKPVRVVLNSGSVFNFTFLLINRLVALALDQKDGPDYMFYLLLSASMTLGVMDFLTESPKEKDDFSHIIRPKNIFLRHYHRLLDYFTEHPNLRIGIYVITQYLNLWGNLNTLLEGPHDMTQSTAIIMPKAPRNRLLLSGILSIPHVIATLKQQHAIENLEEDSLDYGWWHWFVSSEFLFSETATSLSYIFYAIAISGPMVDEGMTWAAALPLACSMLFTVVATFAMPGAEHELEANADEYDDEALDLNYQ